MLLPRTARGLTAAGGECAAVLHNAPALAEALLTVERNAVIAEAGVWFPKGGRLPDFPGHGEWMAVGAWLGEHPAAPRWRKLLARCGGDFSRLAWWRRRPGAPPAMMLSPAAAHRMAGFLRHWKSLERAWQAMLRAGVRTVHLPELDARSSACLRVLQVVTSIQIGGAERIALDLTTALPAQGIAAQLVVLGKPTRTALPAPPGLIDLSHIRNQPEDRAEALHAAALQFGADAIQAHLIRAAEARAIHAWGWPLLLHIHNSPQGWPPDYQTLAEGDATLLLPCAQAVEREVRRVWPKIAARTVWNGVTSGPKLQPGRASDGAFVVAILANPRAQKRLELLPAIARETARRMAPRAVRFVLAGAAEPYSEDSAAALAAFEAALAEHKAHDWFQRVGLVRDSSELLGGADALLSVSAYEGLSLAHLEALAAGVRVVATDAGGTREIAARSPGVKLLPLEATPAEFAEALATPPSCPVELPKSFTRQAMTARVAWLLPSVVRRAIRRRAEGVWLIANNFSTGGAQTSARRLLLALRERGIRVRAAVVQEQPGFPTEGRRALEAAGVPVLAVPPAEGQSVDRALAPLVGALEQDPPQVIFFWNLIASWKVLLADVLLDTRIFDVSPGEMYFSALDRFFEKVPAGLPYSRMEDYGSRLAGVVVKYQAEAARAAQLGCPVTVIPNGVPLFPPAEPRSAGPLVFGTAVRLSPDKKIADLLEALHLAAPKLPPFVLRVAGGPERDFPDHVAELRKLAGGLPVEWLGHVSDMEKFLPSLDLFLMISEPAGCPNAMLEAMAAGLPVIATDHGGAREQVLDGVTGCVTPRGDAAAFAEALIRLAQDAAQRSAFSAAARARAQEHFSMAKMTDAYAALIGAKGGGDGAGNRP